MVQRDILVRTVRSRAADHWRAHLFLFDAKPPPAYDASSGVRLLLIVLLLEVVVGPRLALFALLEIPVPSPSLRVPILLACAMLLLRFFARVRLAEIGLYRWRQWTTVEKSYFVQVLVIANIVFAVVLADRLQPLPGEPALRAATLAAAVTYFLWGAYQEIVYRGMLQTELVRRFGPVRGIVAGNLLFTFGPLHFYHFLQGEPAFPMFAAIFSVGLFLAVLYHRSRNLWIVAAIHGIGSSYLLAANPQ